MGLKFVNRPKRLKNGMHLVELPSIRQRGSLPDLIFPTPSHTGPPGHSILYDMSPDSRKAAFVTLGCRLNQYETDSIAGELAAAGFAIIEQDTPGADLCVINTCSVTGRGEQKSRQAVARMRRLHPDALIIITGCALERDATAFAAASGVLLVDQDSKHGIARLALRELESRSNPGVVRDTAPACIDLQRDRFAFRPPAVSLHTRATLKVQDGCDNHCTYCIVPAVRGSARSRPAGDCLTAARELIALGYHEIVITGVNLQQYTRDGLDLPWLVRELLAIPGEVRWRLSSIEPDDTTPAIVGLFDNPRLCPHLHLCLQSGSDRTLKRMGRRYTAGMFLDIVRELRRIDPLFNVTGDVIVGYPGETENDFDETMATLEEARLTHIHTFQFSPREGTPAAVMDDRVPKPEMQRRSEAVRNLTARTRTSYLETLLGQRETILVEKVDTGERTIRGYGEHYIPITMTFPPQVALPEANTFVPCLVSGTAPGKLQSLAGSLPGEK